MIFTGRAVLFLFGVFYKSVIYLICKTILKIQGYGRSYTSKIKITERLVIAMTELSRNKITKDRLWKGDCYDDWGESCGEFVSEGYSPN